MDTEMQLFKIPLLNFIIGGGWWVGGYKKTVTKLTSDTKGGCGLGQARGTLCGSFTFVAAIYHGQHAAYLRPAVFSL